MGRVERFIDKHDRAITRLLVGTLLLLSVAIAGSGSLRLP